MRKSSTWFVRARDAAPRRLRRSSARSRRHRLLAALEALEPRYLLAFGADLFFDLNQLGVSSEPGSFTELNGVTYFVADDGQHGAELWKSDGTTAGTELVIDLLPGPSGSRPENLTVLANDLIFTAVDDVGDVDLWKTNGTVEGTIQILDAETDQVYDPQQLTESGGKVFFTAESFVAGDSIGYELWVTDGSQAGTMLVRDINTDQTVFEGPRELTDVNGTLFFTSYTNGYDNRELFKSNGTLAGTVLVLDIDGDSLESSDPRNLTAIGNTLYFAAETLADGVELYKSNGTDVGTVQIQDLNPAGDSYPRDLVEYNGQVFFSADNGNGRRLFKSDGNTITPVADATGVAGPTSPSELTVAGADLFFAAVGDEAVPGPITVLTPELTTSNSFRFGNNASSGVAGIVTQVAGPDRGFVRIASNSSLNFIAREGDQIDEGDPGDLGVIGAPNVGLSTIAAGDLVLHDIDANDLAVDAWQWSANDSAGITDIDFSGFISGSDFGDANEGVVFTLELSGPGVSTVTMVQTITGPDLDSWNADRDADNIGLSHPGGAQYTSVVVTLTLRDLLNANSARVEEQGQPPIPQDREALVVNAQLTALGATSGTPGRELHKTDGTPAGTELVKNIAFVGDSNPTELTEVGGLLYFAAKDPNASGNELWVSDGGAASTVLVKDIRPGVDSYGAFLGSDPEQLTEVNGKLFFSAINSLGDRELWLSEGATVNTADANLLKNINEGTAGSEIEQLTPVGNKLYFVANDGFNGEAIWVADPATGTVTMVPDLTPGSNAGEISGLEAYNGGVAFYHDTLGIHFTDGGTPTLLSNTLIPAVLSAEGKLFEAVGTNLFFVTDDPADSPDVGQELFKYDSVTQATSLVFDLFAGSASSAPAELTEFNNQLYYVGQSNNGFFDRGRELIRTDGTAGGTATIDINSEVPLQGDPNSTLPSNPDQLTVSGLRLYFAAETSGAGRELWSINTSNSPSMAADIRNGTNGSNPGALTDVNGVLYFSANNGSDGFEPYSSLGSSVTPLGNINGGGSSSNPSDFMRIGNRVYFSATQSTTGRELWLTTGSAAGTAIVEDLQLGPGSSNPVPLLDVGSDRVLVAANGGEGVLDREVWIAGGPVAGIELAIEINPGLVGSDPRDLVEVAGTPFLIADNGFNGDELYVIGEFAPQVDHVEVNVGTVDEDYVSSINTFTVHFNTIVDVIGDPFAITNTTTTEAVAHNFSVDDSTGTTSVELTFDPGDTVNANGHLEDGLYQLTIAAAGIDTFGVILDGNGDETPGGDFSYSVTRKYGDADGSGLVAIPDYLAFRLAFGSQPGDAAWDFAYDDDGDGVIGISDYLRFRLNFGT